MLSNSRLRRILEMDWLVEFGKPKFFATMDKDRREGVVLLDLVDVPMEKELTRDLRRFKITKLTPTSEPARSLLAKGACALTGGCGCCEPGTPFLVRLSNELFAPVFGGGD